ncbi:MAG: sodium-dependent transporter [Polyangiaceae bacterium]
MRENWKSRWGLILAAAGNAVGIGNLLRFPGQAAQNGGGAFIVPYLISLLIFGLPMMWIAWTLGRFGARHGHGTLPGIFDKLTSWRGAKYLGALGVAGPLVFCFYYTYLEAWCLGYAWFSFRDSYATAHLSTFLSEFQGVLPTGNYFSSTNTALIFMVITVMLNVWVLYRGVAAGIELLAKIAMPLLLVFCVLMCVRVFTLPDAKGSVIDGLAFMWNPDFSALGNPSVWLAAAGQVFFTLSIGFGALEAYASYLRENDDVAVTGLTTAGTNEFVEIIFGSMIAIPAAAVFFGAAAIPDIAASGTFNIGMVSMPEILRATHSTTVFGTIWFLLLFFAAFTSSVAVCQPVMAFLQDEAGLRRGSAAAIIGVLWILGGVPVVYFLRYGFLDELDFWAGTLGLVLVSAIEVVLFAWVFGIHKGWEELHRGALMKVPRVFRFTMQYVTPVALALILGGWVYSDVIMQGKLSPKPALITGIVDRADFPGDFVKKAPSEGDAAHEYGLIKQSLLGAVDNAGRDLKGWAHLELSSEGKVRVTRFEGDPTLTRAIPATTLQRMLELENYHYAVKGNSAAVRATLLIEGLNTKPYIWLARGMILALIAMVCVMIGVIWRQREERSDAEAKAETQDTGKVEEGA